MNNKLLNKKLLTGALTTAAGLVLAAAPAGAGHDHFVVTDNPATGTRTCQYVASGQTGIDDPDHGGHHRFHDNVHTGRPGGDDRGSDFDKQSNVDGYECDVVRGAP